MGYSFSTTAAGSFTEVVDKVEAELAAEGFGVLTRIDMQATLKSKLDVDIPPYLILGACNPPFANRAVAAEPTIGTLLPCNVVVREDAAADLRVEFMDPAAVLELVDSPEIHDIAGEVRARLLRVRDAVAASG
jgi:uncharacterized protein (DUF302 family)